MVGNSWPEGGDLLLQRRGKVRSHVACCALNEYSEPSIIIVLMECVELVAKHNSGV
jgi:hypothetical protein